MQNKIYVAERNAGKTSWLFNIVRNHVINSNKKVVIIDSATEHVDKSLLHKVKSAFTDTTIIYPNNLSYVLDSNVSLENYYKKCKKSIISQDIKNAKSQIVCIDLSFYLERGHEFADAGNHNLAHQYRQIYNNLAQQVALSCMSLVNEGLINEMLVVSDEIEFPKNGHDIYKYQTKNIRFVSAVHPENSFGHFYKSFKFISNLPEESCEKKV